MEHGQDGDDALDLNVRCEVGGENGQENAGQDDIVEVPKTPSPSIDIACEEATTSSFIAASGSSDPIDSSRLTTASSTCCFSSSVILSPESSIVFLVG